MQLDLLHWPAWKLRALHRVAKARGRAFFANPKEMQNLRTTLRQREMIDTAGDEVLM